MATPITVKEYAHNLWKAGTFTSAILCLTLFITFWNISDPFWSGIVRLTAFIFFALAVLGLLKLMNGPLRVTLEKTEGLLLISYQKKGTVIQEEQFEIDTIKQILPAQPGYNPLYTLVKATPVAFKVNFNDTERELFLFEFSGRPLLFTKAEQEKIKQFLQAAEIDKEVSL
ncbi:hypothetical protein G3569_06435 [Aliifodinibius halophilus]|uniref:Uncharacterized protein n=2 Tax=Fodinibius halophilus TaxID=1736908 RepID=A0A6M1TAI0_9BACT|nr:hypothetical protein [Fodinibius halophilus]